MTGFLGFVHKHAITALQKSNACRYFGFRSPLSSGVKYKATPKAIKASGHHLRMSVTRSISIRSRLTASAKAPITVSEIAAKCPFISSPQRSSAAHANHAFNIMDQRQRTLQVLQIGDFNGETHVRLTLFRLGIDANHVEFFPGKNFGNIA